MSANAIIEFSSPPAVLPLYARVLLSRKPAHVADGESVPHIGAVLSPLPLDRAQLTTYAQICSIRDTGTLPIAFPHVLATPLHFAMLTGNAFAVKLLGLVHLRNRIRQTRPIRVDESLSMHAWLEGHREGDFGQEFDMETQLRSGDDVLWHETCTFLARRRQRRKPGGKAARAAVIEPVATGPLRASQFAAPAGLGRRYGVVSRDINPIHLFDATARLFGFRQAIAHGMWSLARCAAEFPVERWTTPVEYEVIFKQPVFIPAALVMERWETDQGESFALKDGSGDKTHLTGTLRKLPQ